MKRGLEITSRSTLPIITIVVDTRAFLLAPTEVVLDWSCTQPRRLGAANQLQITSSCYQHVTLIRFLVSSRLRSEDIITS